MIGLLNMIILDYYISFLLVRYYMCIRIKENEIDWFIVSIKAIPLVFILFFYRLILALNSVTYHPLFVNVELTSSIGDYIQYYMTSFLFLIYLFIGYRNLKIKFKYIATGIITSISIYIIVHILIYFDIDNTTDLPVEALRYCTDIIVHMFLLANFAELSNKSIDSEEI